MKWLFGGLLTVVLGLGSYLYFYLGAYKPVDISVEHRNQLVLIYKNHIGPYHQIMPTIHQAEVFAQAQSLNCERTFGEFLDDPQAVDEDRLRSHAGCVLDQIPSAKVAGLLKSEGFISETRPEGRYVVARFTGSPAVGPFRVYPDVKKYMERERLTTHEAVLEIYRVNGAEVDTEYLFPIAQSGAETATKTVQ